MQEVGLEREYTAHSTRHASTSRALSKGLDLNVIKHAAGWLEDSKVFDKFYNRPVKISKNFAETVCS